MSEIFTCVTCNIAFNNSELQREHYKTDWHRYNLKRKVAELPAVSITDFNNRLKLQKEQQENSQTQKNEELFCKLCSKHFTTANSFANHKQSKKHKELEDTAVKRESESETATDVAMTKNESDYVIKSDRAAKKAEQLLKRQQEQQIIESQEVQMDDEDQSWEDIADEEMDEFDESNAIDLNTCFFCDKKCDNVDAKVEHMAKEHGFYIPDLEHVSDLEGLLKFLGMKLGTYHVCLWCSSKCYRDLLSVQKHMIDKGHQKLKFEGETLLEYADYYSYDDEEGTIDDDYDIVNDSDINIERRVNLMKNDSTYDAESIFGDENYELVLPSGARIGHRSLFKYYKQSFGHRSLEIKQRNNVSVKDKYRAIANGSIYNPIEIKKQRKDLAYFQRWSAKMRTKMGWEANKLQKHFRRQDITF